MAIPSAGVFLNDYLEHSSTLRRLLNNMRELDERSQAMINQSMEQTKYCLVHFSQSNKKGHPEDDEFIEKMKKEIEANQENALSLCTGKVMLAKQAYDLINSQMKHLEGDLGHFSEDVKQVLLSASSIRRSVSPLLKQELVAQVSESTKSNSSSYKHIISLYEVLARVHGKNIVPHIRDIMSTIISTLTSSAGCFTLHQACANVVPAIACCGMDPLSPNNEKSSIIDSLARPLSEVLMGRHEFLAFGAALCSKALVESACKNVLPAIAHYGMDPLSPDNEKSSIIDSLARPLSEVLMGRHEFLASGAALCLKAIVESDDWRFASNQTVNMVCLNLCGALEEKATQTHSHMGLVMSLATCNPLILEGYALSLIRLTIDIYPSSICSKMEQILLFLEKCRSDQFVRSAATEALLNARTIVLVKKLKIDHSMSPYSAESTITCNHSPRSVTPESEIVTSSATSPILSAQSYCNFGRPTIHRLWMDTHKFTGFGSNSEILEAENDTPKDAESNISDEESSDRNSQNSNRAELSPLNKIQGHLKLEFCEWKSSEAANMTDWQNNVEEATFQADQEHEKSLLEAIAKLESMADLGPSGCAPPNSINLFHHSELMTPPYSINRRSKFKQNTEAGIRATNKFIDGIRNLLQLMEVGSGIYVNAGKSQLTPLNVDRVDTTELIGDSGFSEFGSCPRPTLESIRRLQDNMCSPFVTKVSSKLAS
ncbi:PHD finger protein [Nymphaea thermarum]|nr:PHD finger protein [Nymphaea thermarum]